MSKEFINIRIEKEIYEILKYWNEKRKKEIKEGKSFGTREPLYKVQRQIWVQANEDGFEREELCIDCETCVSLEQIKEGCLDDDIQEQKEDYLDQEQINTIKQTIKNCDNLEDVQEAISEYGIEFENNYIWYSKEDWNDQAYFMTYEEAERYRQYQKHNLGVSRIYVASPGYANAGTLNKFLDILDHNHIFKKNTFRDKLKNLFSKDKEDGLL